MQNTNQKFIINSLLDTDMYKFTMQQTVYHQFANAKEVEFSFKCRTPGVDLASLIVEINSEVDHLCELMFKPEELEFLGSHRFIKSDYIDFLTLFRLQRKYITITQLNENEIDVAIKGPWLHTIPFEIYVLSIINELYFRHNFGGNTEANWTVGKEKLAEKIAMIKGKDGLEDIRISDFGTRRRFSFEWQDYVVGQMKQLGENFTGTSNVYFAWKHGVVSQGTMAHEFLQACQALGPRLRDSQKFALNSWVNEFRGDLGIALTDVVGVDAFLRDFDLFFCKLFDGVRHDSGDTYEWTDKILAHYKKMRINAKEKSLVYSDGLSFPKAIALYETYRGQAKLFFGIGTNLTNDLGPKALNIVIKMTSCNGSPVAKLSDSDGKVMCNNEAYLTYLKQVFDVNGNVS